MQIIDNLPPISGMITYWSLAEGTSLSALAPELERLDLLDFLPNPQSPESALHSALVQVFGGQKRTLIRPLQDKGAFAVVHETPYRDTVSYSQEGTVKVHVSGDAEVITCVMVSQIDEARIRTEYENRRRVATAAAMGTALIKILQHLGALCLRPKGGVYWIPEHQVKAFKDVAEAVERSKAYGRDSDIYCVRTALSVETIRAVSDALTHEITSTVEEITTEVSDDARAIRHSTLEDRQQRLVDLRLKIGLYEGILGTTFDALKDATARAESLEAFDALKSFAESSGISAA